MSLVALSKNRGAQSKQKDICTVCFSDHARVRFSSWLPQCKSGIAPLSSVWIYMGIITEFDPNARLARCEINTRYI